MGRGRSNRRHRELPPTTVTQRYSEGSLVPSQSRHTLKAAARWTRGPSLALRMTVGAQDDGGEHTYRLLGFRPAEVGGFDQHLVFELVLRTGIEAGAELELVGVAADDVWEGGAVA